MNKTGNQHSSLLDAIVKTASETPSKPEVEKIEFPKGNQPSLEQVLADVSKGKNVNKTAQWEDFAPPEMGRGRGGPGRGMGFRRGEGWGDAPEPNMPEAPVEESLSETTGDVEAAKKALVDALIALCGSSEAACDCITAQGNGEEELPLEENVLEEPLGEEPVEEMPSPMPAPMPM